MTDRPIDLDGHRTPEGKIGSELRRKAVNQNVAPDVRPIMPEVGIDAALLDRRARTWTEGMEKVAFLHGRYSSTKDADDPKT